MPSALGEMMKDSDRRRARRVMEAMLGMKKLDIAGLRRAYEGARAAAASRRPTRRRPRPR